MKNFYNPASGGFYSDRAHGNKIPADSVEITQLEFDSLMAEQSKGKQIHWDKELLKPVAGDIAFTLEQSRERKQAAINFAADDALAALINKYPKSETGSWGAQEIEAREFTANNLADTPLLDAMVLARGIDKAVLSSRIIVNADTYKVLSGRVFGQRQALSDAVNAAATVAEVDAIAVSFL